MNLTGIPLRSIPAGYPQRSLAINNVEPFNNLEGESV
jgi:hypothetical protein